MQSNQDERSVDNFNKKSLATPKKHKRSSGRIKNGKSYQKQQLEPKRDQEKSSVSKDNENRQLIKSKLDSANGNSNKNHDSKNEDTKPVLCVTLEEFSKHAQDIKSDIVSILEKQAKKKDKENHPDHVEQLDRLKTDIETITQLHCGELDLNIKIAQPLSKHDHDQSHSETTQNETEIETIPNSKSEKSSIDNSDSKCLKSEGHENLDVGAKNDENSRPLGCKKENFDSFSTKVMPIEVTPTSELEDKENKNVEFGKIKGIGNVKGKEKEKELERERSSKKEISVGSNQGAELSSRRFDVDTQVSALLLSLQGKTNDPQMLESICKRLVQLSENNCQLQITCSKLQSDNEKLSNVKKKLEDICRELQKSNTAIRIENLELIKGEQQRSREMTTKFQSTLNDLIRLFEENQQRNLALRQENLDLHTRLKSLVEHCENWEKSVESTLRQRDIENRLVKTELAKANLLKNEEKEKFLIEKQELLQILSMMQERQQRIEGQEAKLRLDLSQYASKYDECQAVISEGMNKFQTETKKMLKQIERSKQDYQVLLNKYQLNCERLAKLLQEKQQWDNERSASKRRIDNLLKLCRALHEREKLASCKSVVVTSNDNQEIDINELSEALAQTASNEPEKSTLESPTTRIKSKGTHKK